MLLHDIQFQDELVATIHKAIGSKKDEMWNIELKTIEEYRERSGYIRALHEVLDWIDGINRDAAKMEADSRKVNR